MNVKRLGFVVVVLVLLVVAVGAVSAQRGDGRRGGDEGGHRADRGRPGVEGVMRGIVQIITDETGLEPREILEQVQAGKTLAQVITENGGDVQAVIDSAIEKATERANTAVENGRITQERADEMLAELPEKIETLLNADMTVFQFAPRVGQGLMWEVAREAGLDRQAMREAIQSGKSLADILSETGVDMAVFIDEQIAKAETRLTQAVENGRLSQEEADTRLDQMRDNLNEALEYNFPVQPQEA